MAQPILLTFGQLESILAISHDIGGPQRTKFQSRLKNFQRLGLLPELETVSGKAVLYGAGDILRMAIATEFAQLGLSPERIVSLVNGNIDLIAACTCLAAREVLERGRMAKERSKDDPPPLPGYVAPGADAAAEDELLAMFLYFDPTALQSLMDPEFADGDDMADRTFFYGGIGVVRDMLPKWTSGVIRRLALINVTTVVIDLSDSFGGTWISKGHRKQFLKELIAWCERERDRDDGEC